MQRLAGFQIIASGAARAFVLALALAVGLGPAWLPSAVSPVFAEADALATEGADEGAREEAFAATALPDEAPATARIDDLLVDATGALNLPVAEFQVAVMINALRAEHGVAPLEVDAALVELARERSTDMATRRYFSHEIPGTGYAPLWLLEQLPDALGTGENLGLSDENNDVVLESLFAAWVASPTHLANMLLPEFTHVGVGAVKLPGPPGGASTKIITQVFAIASGPLTRA